MSTTYKKLSYDGKPTMVDVAEKDSVGNVIKDTYAKKNDLDTLSSNLDSTTEKADKNAEDILSLREYTSDELSNRYTKSQTYTKDEVNTIIQQIEVGEWQIVSSLPTTGEEGKVYLVGTSQPYDMYIWESEAWLKIGTTQIDLSGYVPTSRTINGYSLTNNVTISKSDVGLGSVVNSIQSSVYQSKLADSSIYYTQNGAYNLYSELSSVDGALLTRINSLDKDITDLASSIHGTYVKLITSASDTIIATRTTSTETGVSYTLTSKLSATDVSI